MKEKDHFNWFYTPVESNLKRYRTDVSIYTMFSLLTMLWNQGLPETQFLIATVAYLIPELREEKASSVGLFILHFVSLADKCLERNYNNILWKS